MKLRVSSVKAIKPGSKLVWHVKGGKQAWEHVVVRFWWFEHYGEQHAAFENNLGHEYWFSEEFGEWCEIIA